MTPTDARVAAGTTSRSGTPVASSERSASPGTRQAEVGAEAHAQVTGTSRAAHGDSKVEAAASGARAEVPSSRAPAGDGRRSRRGGTADADAADGTTGELQKADGGSVDAQRPEACETESSESSVPVARTAGYQEEAAELLEAASAGSTPARRRRKPTGGESGEPTAKTTRANRRGGSTRPPATG